MAEELLSSRPDYGRTFNSAMWITGFIAFLQVFAAGWAVLTRTPKPAVQYQVAVAPTPLVVPAPQNQPLVPIAPPVTNTNIGNAVGNNSQDVIPFETPVPPALVGAGPTDPPIVTGAAAAGEGDSEFSNMPITNASGSPSIIPEPSMIGPVAVGNLGESLAGAADSVSRIEDPLLERLVAMGKEHRASGNMPRALKDFREAETALPDHPMVLSELAGTFSQMGLDEQANSYWEKVVALGPIVAGKYYTLADRALKGEGATAAGSSAKILKIEEVRVNEQPDDGDGQWVSLQVHIAGDPAVRPSGMDMAMLVYFYDIVDGKKIDSSTADTLEKFPTEPYDWQDKGLEEIEVFYHQPIFNEEQKKELGDRKYHGYVIELYYRDQLQDRIAMPEVLMQLRMEEMSPPPPGSENISGPENTLFPAPSNP